MLDPAAVLIVDDDDSTQGLLSAVVRRLGLRPLNAGDGRQALTMIAADRPSAIVLDLLMPKINGFELLRHFKRNSPELLARTIVVSAASGRLVDDCREIELVWRFFRKPLDIDQFGRALLDCIGASRKTGRDGAYEAPPRP